MARNNIDILLSIEDKATKALDKLEQKTRSTEKTFKSSAININQSLELVKKAIRGVTVAFDFFESGAKLKQQEQAFKRLASVAGVSSDALVRSMKAMAGETITSADAMAAATKSMVLGLQPEQLPKLMEISRAAARNFGTDVTFMFDSLSLGIGRQSRMLLDNLGIIVDAESAYQAYADEIGSTVSELSDFEKKQAFANAAIKAGEKQVKEMGDKALTNAENILSMRKAWEEFTNELSKFINESPVVREWIVKIGVAAEELLDVLNRFAGKKSLEQLKQELVEVQEKMSEIEERNPLEKFLRKFTFAGMLMDKFSGQMSDLQVKEQELKAEIEERTKVTEEATEKIKQALSEQATGYGVLKTAMLGLKSINDLAFEGQLSPNEELAQAQEQSEQERRDRKLQAIFEFQEQIALMSDEELAREVTKLEEMEALDRSFEQNKTANLIAEQKKRDKAEREAAKLRKWAIDQSTMFLGQFVKDNKAASAALSLIRNRDAVNATFKAANQALEQLPFPINLVAAGVVTAAGLANAAQIGFAEGTDTVPSMLTPGEMVIPRSFASAIREGRLTLGGGGGSGGNSVGDINIFIQGGIDPAGSSVEEMAERLGFEFEQQLRTSTGV